MREPLRAAFTLLTATATLGHAQTPATRPSDPALPAPGTRGNADNIPYIGRSDPKGNPVRLAKATGHLSNYSEEKLRPYSLPDPLVMVNGERVTSADQWAHARRPEILKLYREQIYGGIPANAPKVTWEVTQTDPAARGGAAIMKRVTGRMGDKPDGPKMTMTVHLPTKASGPVPMLLSITFGFPPGARGQAAAKKGQPPATTSGEAESTKSAAPKGRIPGGFDALGEVLGRGWGYAALNYSETNPTAPIVGRKESSGSR
jgi:hypothetical protein